MKKNITNHSRLPFFIGTILLIVFTIGVAANGIAQTTVVKEVPVEKTYFDNGYYKYEMTGNTEIDTENQKVAKEEFVEKFPELYQKMIAESKPDGKHAIDYKEYLNMPANKKTNIDAHPDLYYFINK